MKRVTFIAATIAVLFSACNSECRKECCKNDFDLEKAKAAIAESNKTYGAPLSIGDSAAFLAHYTSDACIMAPNMPKMCDAASINAFFNGGRQMGIRNIALQTESVSGGPVEVVEMGTYELQGDSSKVLDKGKYILVWKQEDGKWKMHRDIWNSDTPMETAAN